MFSSAEKNVLIASTLEIARRCAGLPPLASANPGMFARGDPGAFRRAYEQAGYREVAIRAIPVLRRFPSVAAAMQSRRDSPPAIQIMADLSDTEREIAPA